MQINWFCHGIDCWYQQNIGIFWLPLQLIFMPTWILWQLVWWFIDIFIPDQIQQTINFYDWVVFVLTYMWNLGPQFWIPFLLMSAIMTTIYSIFLSNFVINILIMSLYLEQWKIISNSVGKVVMSIIDFVIMLLTQSVMMLEYGIYFYWQTVFIWVDLAH